MRLRMLACAAIVACCLATWAPGSRVAADTGIGYWTFEDVAPVGLMPGCGPSVTINGFAYDPQDRPVLGWNAVSGCSIMSWAWWSRREGGAWATNEFTPNLPYLAGGDSDTQHRLGVAPDGTPYMMFRAIDASTGDNNVYSYLANLASAPHGETVTREEFLVGSQNCYYGWHYLDFAPNSTAPQWLTTLNLCTPWYGQMWLNGAKFLSGTVFNGADFAIGPDGAHHVVYAATTVFYSRGDGAGLAIPDMSKIDPNTNQPAPLQINRFSGDVQIVVDPSNTIHVFARGYNSQADYDLGELIRVTSMDGGLTWSAPEQIDTSHQASNVAATLDRNGVLALAYWRFGQLWYATHAAGQWDFSQVTALPYSGDYDGDRQVGLAFDSGNVPAIAFFDWNYNLDGVRGKIRLAHPAPAGANGPVDLAATFSDFPDPTSVNSQVTLTAGVENRSARNATNVDVAVTLPSSLQYVGSTPSPSSTSGATRHFALGTLSSGGAASVAVVVTSTTAQTATTTVAVTASQSDPNAANNTVSGDTRFLPDTCFTPSTNRTRWLRAERNFYDSAYGAYFTAAPGVGFTDGVYGAGFAFDGTGGLSHEPWDDWQDYPNAGSFSIDAWLKTTAGGMIASKYECANAFFCAKSYYFFSVSGGHLGVSIRDSSGVSMGVAGGVNVADGALHHVAFVLDRTGGTAGTGEVRLYVDGAVDTRADASAIGFLGDGNGIRNALMVGARQQANGPDTEFFTGMIDELAVHQRALSDAEVQTVASAPFTAACGANVPPTIMSPGAQTTPEGSNVTLAITASDANGDPLTFSAAGLPPGLSISTDGVIRGVPTYDAAGTYGVTITVTDGVTPVSVSFAWYVTNVNRAPAPQPDAYSTAEDDRLEVAAPGVLGNDSDPDGDALTAHLLSTAAHGTLTLASDGGFSYVPAANYNGPDSFTYAASDGTADSAPITVALTVTAVNDAPVASTAVATTQQDTSVSIALAASDIDSASLTYAVVSQPQHGTVAIGGSTATYTPAPGYSGPDGFTFVANDGSLDSNVASVAITVTPATPPPDTNHACDCSRASPSVSEITPPNHRQVPIDILGITDPDDDPIRITITGIFQDEPTNTVGDGTTLADGGGIGTSQAWVRAERTGTAKVPGNGRVYEIQFTAGDGRGGSCQGKVLVGVPHDQGHGPAVDDLVRYDSTVGNGPRIR